MQHKENYIRIKEIASYPQTLERMHVYKSGKNIGKSKKISAQQKRIGLIQVSEKTIWTWVREGKFPRPIKIGRNVTVWKLSEVLNWLNNNTIINQENIND